MSAYVPNIRTLPRHDTITMSAHVPNIPTLPRHNASHWRKRWCGSLSCSKQSAIKFPWTAASWNDHKHCTYKLYLSHSMIKNNNNANNNSVVVQHVSNIIWTFLQLSQKIDWFIDWLVFYSTSTQDRSICANLPGGITGTGVWGYSREKALTWM